MLVKVAWRPCCGPCANCAFVPCHPQIRGVCGATQLREVCCRCQLLTDVTWEPNLACSPVLIRAPQAAHLMFIAVMMTVACDASRTAR